MADDAAPDRELRPVGRYEWEQILRRARLDGVIAGSGRIGKSGKPTRGGMTGTTFKAIAFGWASWGNDRGQEIWPGDATVAVALETTIDRVAAVRRKLLELGLLEFVRPRTGRRGDEYRLTLPSDLMDALEVLSPAQVTLAAGRMRDEARGKHRTGRGPRPPAGGPPDPPESVNAGGPVDTPKPAAEPDVGGPVDHPERAGLGGPVDPRGADVGGPVDPRVGGPAEARTDHDRTSSTTTDQNQRDLRTDLAVARASPPEEPRVSAEVRASRCATHGLAAGDRPDGTPRCPLCRVEARIASKSPPALRLVQGGAA